MPHPTHAPFAWPSASADREPRLQKIDTEVVIHASCAAVHAYASNAARWREWHPATRSVEAVPDRPLRLGETVLEHIRAGGRRFSATWAVIGIDAPRLWVIATDTPQGIARISYRLSEERGAGGVPVTRFHRTLEFRTKPWLLRQLDPWVRRWVLTPQSRTALDNLKRIVESA